ncbi:MAG TPA: DUF2179 domain-containing protein [Gemmataceae bacterium]|nr:DUF2179 domain-containing protein [Gemmataceae bacterium]
MDASTLLVPLLIFLAELCVVTIGTLRIIFVARSNKIVAPVLGFFESFIWLVAISQIMRDHSEWTSFVAFGLGFALGNYVGIMIEKRLALGTVIVRIITRRDPTSLIARLRGADFGVTAVEGQGATGKVQIVMTVVKRRQLPQIVTMIETHHPNTFYAVDELQSANEGIFPTAKERPGLIPLSLVSLVRLMMPHKEPELATEGYEGADGRRSQADNPEPAPLG